MAKVISHTTSNPKLSMRTPVKGYAAGGEVVDTRPVVSKTVYVDSRGGERPSPARGLRPVTKEVREGEGLVYSAYDTTMEDFAKAPSVGFGEAAKVQVMPEIAKPGDVQYYGTSQKDAADKLTQQRYAAYNRRLENAAIRTGNVMPGVEAPKAVYSEVPKQTQKAVQLALPKTSEKAQAPKVSSMKLTPDSLVNVTAMLSPQSKVLYKASDFIDYLNQRKKKNEV